ncbi:unnamed protein product [Nezara viridula]|uniref:CHK kinase-like domain-containing protein n=1 Tax=Nezara viridula TaxID=85310 RepID=A0A9P0HRA8_NEZVI|nr:unnamed protein product [Nezara viridula]
MEKEILECVLKRNCKDLTPEKVVSLEIVPAVEKYVNFLSSVNRYNLKVVLGNGRTVKKSLFVKTASTDAFIDAFNNRLGTFKNETMMYTTLKEMEYLMEEFQDYDDILWCRMIYHIPYTCIVMEDLKAKGFRMVGKTDLFDFEQGMLGVHALGRYHGMCKALEERGHLSLQGLRPWFIFDKDTHHHMYWSIVSLVEGIKKLWDPKWIPVVEKIKLTTESLTQRLEKLNVIDETKFNVLNHGDVNKNNIVFKFNYDERPVAVRFVDFQMLNYGSPCIDLMYYIYLALQPSIRHENFQLFVRTYYNALINTLDKYQYKGNKPNIEEIIEDMEKYSFVGLYLFLTRYPTLYMSEDHKMDAEKIKATDGREGFPDQMFKPENLEDAIGTDLKTFVELFF